MGWTIGPDQTGAIDRKPNRQALNGHIMHNLIIAALQEGRINGGKGLHPVGGKARGKGHGMLLCNADIKGARGKPLGK